MLSYGNICYPANLFIEIPIYPQNLIWIGIAYPKNVELFFRFSVFFQCTAGLFGASERAFFNAID